MTFRQPRYTLLMIALLAAVLLVLPVVSGRLLISEPCAESDKTEVDSEPDSEPDSSHAALSAFRSCLRHARRTNPWRWHLSAILPVVGDVVRYEGARQAVAAKMSFRARSCPLLC